MSSATSKSTKQRETYRRRLLNKENNRERLRAVLCGTDETAKTPQAVLLNRWFGVFHAFDADWRNWSALAAILHDSSEPLPAFLKQQLSKSMQELLASAFKELRAPGRTMHRFSVINDGLAVRLRLELDRVAEGTRIFTEDRFQRIALRPRTRELLAKPPQSSEPLLNRYLLEDAYPTLLARDRIPFSTGDEGEETMSAWYSEQLEELRTETLAVVEAAIKARNADWFIMLGRTMEALEQAEPRELDLEMKKYFEAADEADRAGLPMANPYQLAKEFCAQRNLNEDDFDTIYRRFRRLHQQFGGSSSDSRDGSRSKRTRSTPQRNRESRTRRE